MQFISRRRFSRMKDRPMIVSPIKDGRTPEQEARLIIESKGEKPAYYTYHIHDKVQVNNPGQAQYERIAGTLWLVY